MNTNTERARIRARIEVNQLSQAAVAREAGFSETSLWHRMNDRALSDDDVKQIDDAIDKLREARP